MYKVVKTNVKNRYDTLENWKRNNPVLLQGEIGIVSDTNEFCVGDGTTPFSEIQLFSFAVVATALSVGLCRPDGKTIEINDGVLSVVGSSLTIPLIEGEENVIIGKEYTYRVSSSSGLANGKVLSFEFDLDGRLIRNVDAVDNAAETKFLFNEEFHDGQEADLRVTAKDNYGNTTRPATKTLHISTTKVVKPSILVPEKGSIVRTDSILVTNSSFSSVGEEDTYVSSSYRISRDKEGRDVVYTSEDITVDGDTHTLLPSGLLTQETYYLWMRHKGELLGYSEWSDPVEIRTPYIEKPSVVRDDDQKKQYYKKLVVSSSEFHSYGLSDRHTETDWKIARDANGEDVVLEKSSSGETTYTFTSGLEKETTYYVFVRYKGETIGYSEWSDGVSVKTLGEIIDAPILVSPTPETEVYFYLGIHAAVEESFEVRVGEDTHLYTEWKITSDSRGEEIVHEEKESASLYAYTFSNEHLEADATYYVFARFIGASGTPSDWTSGVLVRTTGFLLTEGKRKLYRHSSGMGSVMEFNDGKDRKVVILDAVHRSDRLPFGAAGQNSPLTDYQDVYNKNGNYDIDGDGDNDANVNHPIITDAELNVLWATSIDKNTSKQNCDVWMRYVGQSFSGIRGVPPVEHCRAISVDGVPCDLPNLQIMMRILCEANNIDLLDPTVTEVPEKALGDMNPNGFLNVDGNGSVLWSSTEFGATDVRMVHAAGYCTSIIKTNQYAAIPVLEL